MATINIDIALRSKIDRGIQTAIQAIGTAAQTGGTNVDTLNLKIKQLGGGGASGAKTAANDIRQLGTALQETSLRATLLNSNFLLIVRSLRTIAGLTTVFASGNAFVKTIDNFQNIGNQLRPLTESREELDGLKEDIFALAQESRTPIGSVVTLFKRLENALKALGVSRSDVLELTETITKLFAISGVGPNEAASALLQLSQAFNKGKLDGDEFRSVAELIPQVLVAIQDELGVTRGELFKLSKDGKLTNEVLLSAFENIAKTVDQQFGEVVQTFGQSFTKIGNALQKFIGESSENLGITGAFATITNALLEDARLLQAAFISLSAVITARLLPALVTLISTLATSAFAALLNPVTAIVTGLTLLVAAIVGIGVAFRDSIKISKDGLTTLGDTIDGIRAGINTLFGGTNITESIGNLLEGFDFSFISDFAKGAIKKVEDIIAGIRALIQTISEVEIEDIFKGAGTLILSFFAGVAADIVQLMGNAFKLIADAIIPELAVLAAKIANLFSPIDLNLAEVRKGAEESINAIKFSSLADNISKSVRDGIKKGLEEDTFTSTLVRNFKKFADESPLQGFFEAFNRGTDEATTKRIRDEGTIFENIKLTFKNIERIGIETYDKINKAREESSVTPKFNIGGQEILGTPILNEELFDSKKIKIEADETLSVLEEFVNSAKSILEKTLDLPAFDKFFEAFKDATQPDRILSPTIDNRSRQERFDERIKELFGPRTPFGVEEPTGIEAFGTKGIQELKVYGDTVKQTLSTAKEDVSAFSSEATTQVSEIGKNFAESFKETDLAAVGMMLGAKFATEFGVGINSVLTANGTEAAPKDETAVITQDQALTTTNTLVETLKQTLITLKSEVALLVTEIGTNLTQAFNTTSQAANLFTQGLSTGLRDAIQAANEAVTAITAIGTAASSALQQVTALNNASAGGGGGGFGDIFGFQHGGYTGGGAINRVAGVVHGQEFVMPADATRRHRGLLEALRSGQSLPTVGPSQKGSSGLKLTVNNYSGASISTQTLSNGEVIMMIEERARQVVRKELPKVFKAEINNANSRVSKSITKNTSAKRRR